MVDDGTALGRQQDSNKLLSKHRWRAKIFDKSADDAAAAKKAEKKTKVDEDLSDFLKPSTDKAQAHKEAAAAALLAAAKPRIDVAKAQRWPGASDVLGSAGGRSPGVGGLRTGKSRKKGLTVSFARTEPEYIGRGGDECDEPSIEVSRRKQSNGMSEADRLGAQVHQDDWNLGLRSPKFHETSMNKEAERRGIVTRTLTHGGLSPPLQQKLEMGRINSHATPPPAPPQRMGTMGLGDRPKPLQRTATGFDDVGDGVRRPSVDTTHSTFSYDSENMSPDALTKVPSLAPTLESMEEDEFQPRPLARTHTGWSEHAGSSDDEPPEMPHRLPVMNLKDDDGPLEASLPKHFLESEPSDPHSFSARVMHRMRAEEGRALQEATRKASDGSHNRDSDSSTNSFRPGSVQSNAAPYGTPPSSYVAPTSSAYAPAPPKHTSRETPIPPNQLNADDPCRSRARGPSPARWAMPPGAFPIDTSARPASSASSHHTMSSAVSRTRESPSKAVDRVPTTLTNSSIQQTPSSMERQPFSATSGTSILPTPPQFETASYMSSPQSQYNHLQSSQEQLQSPRMPPQAQGSASLNRSNTQSQAELAFTDFAERVTHMQGIFRLTAELGGSLYDFTPMQWLRVAIWWFLKGRVGMENLIRSRPKGGEAQVERLTQAHVDLAKAWWIMVEVVDHHPGLRKYANQWADAQARAAREANDVGMAEVFEVRDLVLSSLKMLLGSMKRHRVMPPTQALIQGQDQSIWVQYPNFAPDAKAVLSGAAPRSLLTNGAGQPQINPANCIPLGDSKTYFCYFRMFVNVSLSTDDPNTDRVPLPAVISVLRPREEFKVALAVCSLTELVNVMVQSNPDAGPTWRDVTWKSKTRGFSIQLRHGFILNAELSEQDFRNLWSIVDHTNRVGGSMLQRQDERLSCKMYLREFSYKDPSNPGAFPPERVKGCKLVVYEKFERSTEGTGKRKLHRGYRIVVVTNTKNKTLSCVTHELGTQQEPMNFEYASDPPDNAPAMTLRFKGETPDKKPKLCTMYIVFNDNKERNHLFGTFTSMNISPEEEVFAQVPLKGFSIESADQADGFAADGQVLKRLQWQDVKVMNQDPEAAGLETAPTVLSESLRVVARHGAGIVSDRMNLGPGDLLVRLPISGAAELTLLRNPQLDMAVAVDSSRTERDIPEALAELLRTLTNATTIRKLAFNSFADLHTVQLAVTGFEVKFDGIASTFSISRRRMVVPIYKQWTANTVRLQIVQQDSIVQLLAFFEDFSHADAMNFQLKTMDVFEKTDKGGKPGIRLVDAKFALPVEERKGEGKMGKEEGRATGWAGVRRKYVCLDQIEYPGEHDDIVIGFDSAETRDRFAEALPSATMQRKFTIMRKI